MAWEEIKWARITWCWASILILFVICGASVGIFTKYYNVEALLTNVWWNEIGIIYLTPLAFFEFFENRDMINKFPFRFGLPLIILNGILTAVANWAYIESTNLTKLSEAMTI